MPGLHVCAHQEEITDNPIWYIHTHSGSNADLIKQCSKLAVVRLSVTTRSTDLEINRSRVQCPARSTQISKVFHPSFHFFLVLPGLISLYNVHKVDLKRTFHFIYNQIRTTECASEVIRWTTILFPAANARKGTSHTWSIH